MCKFGNVTLKVGEHLMDSETPCEECHCSTPPELTCVTQTCPPPPMVDSAICMPEMAHGECCPSYSCVSVNPPSIDVCEVRKRVETKRISLSNNVFDCSFGYCNRASSARRKNIVKFRHRKVLMATGCRLLASALKMPCWPMMLPVQTLLISQVI